MSYFKDVISFELHRGEYYDSVNRYSLYCQSVEIYIYLFILEEYLSGLQKHRAIWWNESESITRFIGEREGFSSVYLEMK